MSCGKETVSKGRVSPFLAAHCRQTLTPQLVFLVVDVIASPVYAILSVLITIHSGTGMWGCDQLVVGWGNFVKPSLEPLSGRNI